MREVEKQKLLSANKDMTETQSNAALFGGSMAQANATMMDLEKSGTVKNAVIPAMMQSLVGLVPLGVGEKVANCALLFGFGRLRSFPVDVWIERVLREKYFPESKNITASVLRRFCATAFGPYGGYAQQYLFHHARLTWKKKKAAVRARGARAALSHES
jgi:3-methyladenine DNA glycosylase/8-oxoguanine DNA glycosylase